jgi:hypothetical protein
MSPSVLFLGLIFLPPLEPPSAGWATEQAPLPSPIPRYTRPPLPAAGNWSTPAPSAFDRPPTYGPQWHTAKKVGAPGNPIIHPEVDTMEFRPTDALPGDVRASVW